MYVRIFALLGVAAACLFGPLGPVGAEPAKKKKERSPYAGTYTGTFTASSAGGDQEGESTMTIDDDGNITGESKNTTINQTATIKGTILKDNKSAIVFEFANGAKYSAVGTFSRTSNGGFTGTMIQRSGATAFGGIEFELKPKNK